MTLDRTIQPADLLKTIDRLFELAIAKVRGLASEWNPEQGAPVFTAAGRYTSRGWTEWTAGFQWGMAILAYDATGEAKMLDYARQRCTRHIPRHVTHFGVHDHGFNVVSTFGNLRRLMLEKKIPENEWELAFYELALKASGAVQARRWSCAEGDLGYIYSFNGPHSLFVDTMRTLRSLALAHQLGHVLMLENDREVSLLDRLVLHGRTTARFNLFYGEKRDHYDVPPLGGRTAHEAIFNVNDDHFRCPSSQQGYSPFSTWTRGLAWAILGFAEQLEFFSARCNISPQVMAEFQRAATATADFYLDHATASDGIPYWDTGAPGLRDLGDWQTKLADPFNDFEPVDSSAAAIAAQGLIRLGRFLGPADKRYQRAGMAIAAALLSEPYLCSDRKHQGLLLHSVYHRPKGWDYVPPGRKIPCGESSMWGDYHLLELSLMIRRMAKNELYLKFFD